MDVYQAILARKSVRAFKNQEISDEVLALLPIGYPQDPSPVRKFRLPLEKIVMPESWKSE